MRVLIACEFSGIVRDAFTAKGHDAYSCDLLPTERPGKHFKMSLFNEIDQWVLSMEFDLIIAHPPCTHLSVSGARWFKEKELEQRRAVNFFMLCINAPAKKVAVENPISIMSTKYRKPDQIIQPWQFGHGETKATCLWLKNLPKLIPTNIVEGREGKVWKMAPGPNRAKDRSRTYEGIAKAMAEQWS